MTKAQKALKTELDFRVDNQGTICVLYPDTPAAEQWATDHLPADAQTWGGNGIVVEHRYIDDILFGIHNDGLTFEVQ